MLPRKGQSTRTLVVAGVLGLAAVLAGSLPAQAETSAHRLQRKLHKLEKKAGKALDEGGRLLLEAMPVAVEIGVSLFDDDDESETLCAAKSHHAHPESGHSTPARPPAHKPMP